MTKYAGAQDVYDTLEAEGLLASQGHQVFPKGLTPGAESVQGVLYSTSLFSDMSVASYYIEIFYLKGQSFQTNTQQMHQARADDESALVALAAESWCAILTRGDVDADIPGNIADLLLEALGEGEIVWSRQIPEAEWFTPPFANTGDLLSVLEGREFGFNRRPLDDAAWLASADPYIHECIAEGDGSFALGILDVVTKSGEPARLLVDLFVEEQMADYLTTVFPSYFPIARPNNTIADNGWLIRVSQDHAKFATSYDLEDAANLIRAALFPAEEQEEARAQRVFTYYTNDGGEHGIFGCRAETEDEAEKVVRAAGHREYLLFDNRELEAHETSAAATERILENPFLGALWVPLVDAIDVATGYLRPGAFWTLDCYSRAHNYNAYASPFAQAILEHDGSLHIEVSGRNDSNNPITGEQYAALEFLGWTAPTPLGFGEGGSLPNPSRLLEPGWNGRGVAAIILEALTIVYEVSEADLFNFGEALQESIVNLGTLEHIEGPIFGIPNSRPKLEPEPEPEPANFPIDALKVTSANVLKRLNPEQERRKVSPSDIPHDRYPFGLSGDGLEAAWKIMNSLAEQSELRPVPNRRQRFRPKQSALVSLEGLAELLETHWGSDGFAPQISKIRRLLSAFPEHPPLYGDVDNMLLAIAGDEKVLATGTAVGSLTDDGVAVAALLALFKKDRDISEHLRWHPCAMVRRAAERRAPKAEVVRDECACGTSPTVDRMRHWFRQAALLPPAGIPRHLELLLEQRSTSSWSTQPLPNAFEDYSFSTIDYLSGRVPDQFAVSHAGHGANSYGISVRVVAGNVALLAQTLWGGVYTKAQPSRESWHETRAVIHTILLRSEAPAVADSQQRELLITYSDFRTRPWTVERLNASTQESESFSNPSKMLARYFPVTREDLG